MLQNLTKREYAVGPRGGSAAEGGFSQMFYCRTSWSNDTSISMDCSDEDAELSNVGLGQRIGLI